MDDANTQNMPDGRSFEERVFARFDSLDARRQRLEDEAAHRALETKPIWERALAEIVEVREAVYHLSRKVDALGGDMLQLRAGQARVEERMDRLEAERRD